MIKKIKTFLLISLLIFSGSLFASEASSAAYVEGCRAFSRGEWSSAVFLLKQAASYPENVNPDTYYMLIAAEIYADDNKAALGDCDDFLKMFPESLYVPRIQYMKGKILYSLGDYEKSIIVLSDFCHRNEESDLYPLALFYIAECLFNDYKYEEAESIYERIVTQFPSCEKVSAAQYRIDNIAQKSREEKLLYLLKQTGEEYLAAKEDYEKQLRLYNSEAINTTRERLLDAQQKNRDLEEQISELENQIAELKAEKEIQAQDLQKMLLNTEKVEVSESDETIILLKAKALLIQQLMNKNEAQNDAAK